MTPRDALAEQMQMSRSAAPALARADSARKNAVLRGLDSALEAAESDILHENARDIAAAQAAGYPEAMLDRLRLDAVGIAAMATSLRQIADLPDPVGAVIADWTQPSGLQIRRVRTPLGVIGMIYESRPNVTIDAGALCFKSGNTVILRGGKEAIHSNRILVNLFRDALVAQDFDPVLVQLVQGTDRALVGDMLKAQGLIDVIVPRGGKTLVQRVMEEARVPVFAHLEGIVHVYLHASADIDMAVKLLLNAKMRCTSICGAAECLLIDRDFPSQYIRRIFDALIGAGCTLRGDAVYCALDDRLLPATDADWGCEFLAPILAVKMVANQAAAEAHIAAYSSGHTDVILSEDNDAAERFLHNVDSAIVMHNASSQFADGGEFGMGAEIGISTGRMHARGPVGLEQLTTFQYHVRGHGEVRS
ncbi:MAG: glutamate-5-semialdehyde dehydrogenase [Alphaproteobacteria bacterium]|nr:glutamate-5-semialdehyde dehydrogenase [Alphaproteobacteria bacterium]